MPAIVGDIAFRVGNWIEGESLQEAVQRGPRPFPAVHILARDLLSGLEHAHAHGIMVRRIVPASLLVNLGGRGTVTDLRFCSWTLPAIPAGEVPSAQSFMAPEVRDGAPATRPATSTPPGAMLYFAVTGQRASARPAQLRAALRAPTQLPPRPRADPAPRAPRPRPTTATSPPPRCWRTSPRTPAPSRTRR